MTAASEFLAHITEQLRCLGDLTTRAIFGGVGIMIDNRLIGVVLNEVLYLYTDERNRPDYLARGMGPFRPYPNAFDLTTDQYEVPRDIVQNAQTLQEWGRRALDASIASARVKQMAGIERARKAKTRRRES